MLKRVQEVVDGAQKFIDQGATIFFKWTCVHCHSRQTFDKENTLFSTGICQECSGTTDVLTDARADINYLMHIVRPGK